MTGPFATATEFCEFTGMATPSDLSRLQAHLALASAMVRRFTDQTLSEMVGDQVTFGAIERTTLLLPERPVMDVTSVLVGNAPITTYTFVRSGIVTNTMNWTYGATVTYDHGYAETDPEFLAIKTVVIESAARAYTLNRQAPIGAMGTSEAMGSQLMESAGFAPEVFLTLGEQNILADLGKVGIG